MKFLKPLLIVAFGLLFISGCSSAPEVDVEATIAAGLAATQTAMPTSTSVPTNTPAPTDTPVPTDTPEPLPTETEVPPTEAPPTEAPPSTEAVDVNEPETNEAGTFVITMLDDGSRLFEVPDSGFSIVFNDDYEAVDPSDNEMLQQAIQESTETVFSSEQMAALASAGIKLYAVNTTSDSLLAESPLVINIIRQELPIDLTLEEYTQANQTQIGSFLDLTSDVTVNFLQLGETPASTISYTANIPIITGETVEFANTQYLVIDPDDSALAYVVTVGMPVSVVDVLGVTALEIAESFRLLTNEGN